MKKSTGIIYKTWILFKGGNDMKTLAFIDLLLEKVENGEIDATSEVWFQKWDGTHEEIGTVDIDKVNDLILKN